MKGIIQPIKEVIEAANRGFITVTESFVKTGCTAAAISWIKAKIIPIVSVFIASLEMNSYNIPNAAF